MGEQDNRIAELEAQVMDLRDAFDTLKNFQQALDDLGFAKNEEEIIKLAQDTLDKAVEASRCVIYRKTEGGFCLLGSQGGESAVPDMVVERGQWCLENESMTFLPAEHQVGDDKAVALCPLVGKHADFGVVEIHMTVSEESFTEHIRIMLHLFSGTLAAVLENLRMTNTIQESMLKLSKVLESVPHAIFTIDLEGLVTMMNSATEVLFTIEPIDVIDESYDAGFPKHVSAMVCQLITHSDTQDGVSELEAEHKIGDTAITLAISISPLLNAHKEVSGYVFVLRDISLSQEVAKLRQLDHMKNEFISLVSHELRTPIAAVMTYTESLMMEGMVETEEERQEFYETIYKESERLTRLVNDILDLTKMESGKLDYQFAETDIYAAADRATSQILPMAEKRGLTLVLEKPAVDIPLIQCDEDRLLQVYTNILSNAVKFTDEGGIVVRLSLPEGKNHILVGITDTGAGIAPEHSSHIFSKFEQIEEMKHHSTGTGLGMPICKQIVEDGFGGEIWFESEVGKGTTFFFTLGIDA